MLLLSRDAAKVSALREQLNASQECADNITKELEESQTVFQDVTCREQSLKEEVEVLRVQLGEIEGDYRTVVGCGILESMYEVFVST